MRLPSDTLASLMPPSTDPSPPSKTRVAASFTGAPIVGVVRTATPEDARELADAFITSGLQLIEITLTVPDALRVIRELRNSRAGDGPPWIGAGSVTDGGKAVAALDNGAEFLVSPNVTSEVAAVARQSGVFLVMGALTPSEIFHAHQLGADLVKVYPLPPVGGPDYLATVRQPLPHIPVLAAGGFGPAEISDYRRAGAVAFGIGSQLLVDADIEVRRRQVADALAAARGEQPS